MDSKLKTALLLFKEYCQAFKLKPTTNADQLERWTEARGSMIAGTFAPEGSHDEHPPVAWVTPAGEIWIEQNEDLLADNEPAVAEIGEDLLRVAISNKQPIHPTAGFTLIELLIVIMIVCLIFAGAGVALYLAFGDIL